MPTLTATRLIIGWLFLALSSQAASADFSITGSSSGDVSSLTLTANVQVAPSDIGRSGVIYVAANVAGAWVFKSADGTWNALTGGVFPAPYYSGALGSHAVSIIDRLNLSNYGGAEIYVGYGLNQDDMLSNAKFAMIYRVSITPTGVNPPSGVTPGLYFVDAHSQMDHNVDEERVISLMDRGGVYRTLLSAHPERDWADISAFARTLPERIVAAVQIKGRGYLSGPSAAYFNRLASQVANGAFKAMAEVLVFHDDGGEGVQFIKKTDFDDPQVLAAFDEAKRRAWPFIIHVEFAALSREEKESYLGKLARFLRNNPDHPFLMIHMGQLEEPDVRPLLDAHGNLYFMTSHADRFHQIQSSGKPFINMISGESLKPEWRRLMIERPDRFVFAIDNVFSNSWMPVTYLGIMELWWKALSELPADVAHAVAHGNAERLWNLAPRQGNVSVMPPWIAIEQLGPVTGYSANARN